MYFKLSECFKIQFLKEAFIEISIDYPHLKDEFIKIMNYRDSKRYVAFLFENSNIFIENNLVVRDSVVYPAIIHLANINYYAIEEAVLNQPDTLEGLQENDLQYIIGNHYKSVTSLKNINLSKYFDENNLHGCTDLRKIISAI